MKKISFSPVVLIGITGIFLIAFFLVSKASGVELKEPSSKYYEDKSSLGFYGFKRLLEKMDYNVIINNKENKRGSVIVYIGYSESDLFLKNEALKWVEDGNTLVIDGKTAKFLFKKDFIKSVKAEKLNEYQNIKTSKVLNNESLDIFQTFNVLSESSNDYFIIEGFRGNGSIILLPDFNYFNNMFFKNNEIEKAYLIDRVFNLFKSKTIYLREKKAVFNKNPSFLRDFFVGSKSYITYQILLLFILLSIYTGKRFIRPQQIKPREKRKISEHINAVGYLFKQANAESLAANIDINFFKNVICKNKIPFNIPREKYDKAVNNSNFKEGFLLREEITNELKKRSKNE